MHGTLVGVAVFAPLWTSMSIWARGHDPGGRPRRPTTRRSVLYSMEYAYSAGALRGDAGDGLAVFQTAKQQAAKDTILGGDCYDSAKLKALGAQPSDFFDADYVNNVGFTCAANTITPDCTQVRRLAGGDAPLWMSRWKPKTARRSTISRRRSSSGTAARTAR